MSPERTITALWIAWLVSWVVAAVWSSRTEKMGNVAGEILSRIFLIAGAILLFGDYKPAQFWSFGGALKWTLAAITLAGLAFTWWVRIHLGRLWSALGVQVKAGHHVVDTGPYHMVRHPIYSGLILAAFATAIEKGTSFALLGGALIFFSLYRKARGEERFLRLELGPAYDAYARKTTMLVPSIGRKSD